MKIIILIQHVMHLKIIFQQSWNHEIIKYKIQKHPNGIAEGIILAESFLKGSDMCLIVGDNIIYWFQYL